MTPDFQTHAEKAAPVTDLYMDGTRSPIDGSDIGSRTKRKEHMRAHGLVDADDFKGEWAKAKAQREEFRSTGNDGIDWGGRLRETLERAQRGNRRR